MIKLLATTLLTLLTSFLFAQNSDEPIALEGITKIVTGPHVQLILQEGEEESVKIDYDGLFKSEVNVKTTGKTLKVFLDKSRYLPKREKVRSNGWTMKRNIYEGVRVVAYVTFKDLKKITARGDEGIVCNDIIVSEKLKLKLYGENDVRFATVDIGKLKVKSYGSGELKIREGSTKKQVYRLYGEHEINTRKLDNLITKTTVFGESVLTIQARDKVKVNALGEVRVRYTGGGKLNKGIVLGESSFAMYR